MAEQKKEKKGTTVTLRSPDGATLKCIAKVDKKTGGAQAFAVHGTPKNGNGKRDHVRGATTHWKTLDEATKAMQALIEKATKLGWARPAPPLTVRPDSFDVNHLPPATKK